MAYILKITSIAPQRNMQALVRFLLRVPGLSPEQVSKGLKVPPFVVLTAEKEGQVASIKTVLEKLGAVCAIENTDRLQIEDISNTTAHYIKFLSQKKEHKHLSWKHLLAVILIFIFIIVLKELLTGDGSSKNEPQKEYQTHSQQVTRVAGNKQQTGGSAKAAAPRSAEADKNKYAKTSNNDLTKVLHKNPYDVNAWKTLSDNLQKSGNSESAAQAKASYEQALKVQLVLASLARAFGNEPRVEVTEDVVFYRTSYDMNDPEFYEEADKLRDSLNLRFPDKDLVIENYTSQNTVQTIRLKAK